MNISSYQVAVTLWMDRCFGKDISKNLDERNFRFLEEALELVQAGGCTKQDAYALVDYVFNRPVGEMEQEAGGVMVTLAALCQAFGISLEAAAEDEYKRINTPEMMMRIMQKQATKPVRGPLPGKAPNFQQVSKNPVTQAEKAAFDAAMRHMNRIHGFDPIEPLAFGSRLKPSEEKVLMISTPQAEDHGFFLKAFQNADAEGLHSGLNAFWQPPESEGDFDKKKDTDGL